MIKHKHIKALIDVCPKLELKLSERLAWRLVDSLQGIITVTAISNWLHECLKGPVDN